MSTDEQVATVYDIEAAGRDEIESASYLEVASFVASHPRRPHLRVASKHFPRPLTADEFLTTYHVAAG